jgi:hypothetical protein
MRCQSSRFAETRKTNVRAFPFFHMTTIDLESNTQATVSANLTTPGVDSTFLGINFTISGFFFQIK